MARLTEDALAVCPFYAGHNGQMIVCENEKEKVKLSMAYVRASDCTAHREAFCRDLCNMKRCPLYQWISESYGE